MSSAGPERRSPAPQRGFSLMEVLIAMLVLSIGLLGLAALQTQGLRFNQGAYVRSQATILAYDIMDSMRSRRDDLDEYEQDGPPDEGECEPTDASAATEVACWYDALINGLGDGATASVQQQAAPNADYWDVTLRWVDREPREFTGGTRLPRDAAECQRRVARAWDDDQRACMVTQTWTFWP